MSLREQPKTPVINSKYVKSSNGRIFLNNPNLAKLTDMSAVDLQGFEDPVPETVDQLNEMIAKAIKGDKKETGFVSNDNVFDFSKATKKQIVKKAKEDFDADLNVDNDIKELRVEYELLEKTLGNSNDDTGAGSN